MSGGETLQIGRAAPGKMRPGDPEMVEKLGEAGRNRTVLLRLSNGCDGRSPALSPASSRRHTVSRSRRAWKSGSSSR
jgi:hypothetical protein